MTAKNQFPVVSSWQGEVYSTQFPYAVVIFLAFHSLSGKSSHLNIGNSSPFSLKKISAKVARQVPSGAELFGYLGWSEQTYTEPVFPVQILSSTTSYQIENAHDL